MERRAASDGRSLIGLMPVISMWRAYKIPLPVLVSADPYGTLCTPLLDRDLRRGSRRRIDAQARKAGAHALILRDVALDGAAMKAFREVLRPRRHAPAPAAVPSARLPRRHARRRGSAARRAGAKKLKELRRQRNRLAEHGEVRFRWRARRRRSHPRSRYS